jgi:phenylacetic acid degradation operon negative regulatory protein
MMGFRELETGFFFRPENLKGGLREVRMRLAALTADPRKPECALGRVFVVSDLDPVSDLEVRSLWDADAIAAEARSALTSLQDSEARMTRLSNDEAMAESFLVGGRVLRQLVRHPLLPAEILPPAPLADLIGAMKHYDELGRVAWANFLARHDVPHRTLHRVLPLDSRQFTTGLIPATPPELH